jgi:alpha-galactosidase
MPYFDILRPPDSVSARIEGRAPLPLSPTAADWAAEDIRVEIRRAVDRQSILVTADASPLELIRVRWQFPVAAGMRYLGDAWERGYGDLEWRGLVHERAMPWYFLAHESGYDGATHGYGVAVRPGAICYWTVDGGGVSLYLDVRNGGSGVLLRGRTLAAAETVVREGREGESPFDAASAFCRALCTDPRLPAAPVYGANDWYHTYGRSDQAVILRDARLLVSLAPGDDNRPFMVIDAGWQPEAGDAGGNLICGGPYAGARPNTRYPDMPGLAASLRELGARPGIWIRPLAAAPADPDTLLLPVARATEPTAQVRILDPSLPEVLEMIADNFRTLRGWGYELIKHDWATCDILGRWGFQMGTELTNPGWHFADRSRTTAEITCALYRAIREGAGDGLVIGCNTMGHLGAGLFDLQRTGDDTSGHDWERTRKMGVNTLAFRMPQHGAFFAADPDCVGQRAAMPWNLNSRFLDLIARSGTPLFISFEPDLVGPAQARALRAGLAAAANPQPSGEPLDWLDTTVPQEWRLDGEVVHYDWYTE